jgi:hypothetical protein
MNASYTQFEDASSSEPLVRRAYVHLDCQGETVASGDSLVLLECPFRPVQSMYCACCGDFVKLDRVEWSDSRENVGQYRQRVYNSVSLWDRLYYEFLGNAYEGALNLHLDRSGRPKDNFPSLAS